MKVLITGANGFVGSHLTEKLLSHGHEVFALVRSPSKFELKHERLKVIKGDINNDKLAWISLLPDSIETCIHTAGIVHSYQTNDFYSINATGTESLIKNLKTKFDSLHFILVSSLAAAGPSIGQEKRNEEDMPFPVSEYGRSKKLAEEYLQTNAPQNYTLSVIRPPMVIGPRDQAVLDIFKVVQGGFILLPGSDSRTKLYSFVCVYDLVETIVKIAEQKKPSLYYSAHPQAISFDQLILEIKKQIKKKWLIYLPMPLFVVRIFAMILFFISKFKSHSLRLTPDKVHELAATNWTCDGSKSEKELGQNYEYDLEKTIQVTLADYKKRGWI